MLDRFKDREDDINMETNHDTQSHAVCIICDREQMQGIMICDQLICDDCEKEMVRTEVEEERYHYFVDQMKKIWYKKSS